MRRVSDAAETLDDFRSAEIPSVFEFRLLDQVSGVWKVGSKGWVRSVVLIHSLESTPGGKVGVKNPYVRP